MAIVFLIGAIVGLYWVSNPRIKLGILSGLTVAFAGTLALFTNARRQDVFAATAAYAAVLVVFISGNLSTGSDPGTAITIMGSNTTSTLTVTATVTSVLQMATISTVTGMATMSFVETTSSQTSSPTSTAVGQHGLSTGAKVGIITGSILGFIILGTPLVMFFLLRKRRIINQGPQPVSALTPTENKPSDHFQTTPTATAKNPAKYPISSGL
jgi:hypothetical protein